MKEKSITAVSNDPRPRIKSDLERLRRTTDEDIDAQIKDDPDWSDDWNWGDAVLVVPPKKQAISIRVDADVLAYFKDQGPGYQRRINAVLRAFMQQARKKKRA